MAFLLLPPPLRLLGSVPPNPGRPFLQPSARGLALLLLTGVAPALVSGCALNTQTVLVSVQDFWFIPAMIEVETTRSTRLIFLNEGRELHKITGPLLNVAKLETPPPSPPEPSTPVDPTDSSSPTVRLAPGQSLVLTVAPIPGTYRYRCQIRGHAGMTGTVIVRDRQEMF